MFSKIGVICSAKPGLRGDFYALKKEGFSITCYMYYTLHATDNGEAYS
jgi:hypothetical protein